MKIAILGYYGYNNYGDDLMLYSIIKQLKNCNNCEVVVFCKKSGLKFLDDFHFVKKVIFTEKSIVKNVTKYVREISSCKYVFWGGGTCFSNEDGVSIRYFLLAKLLFKKIGFLGIGIGNVTGYNKIKTSFILNISNFITIRDNESYKLIKKIVFHNKTKLAVDLTYLLDLNDENIKSDSSSYNLVSLHNLQNFFSEEAIKKRRYNLVKAIKERFEKDYKKIIVLPLCNEDYNENTLLYKELLRLNLDVELSFSNTYIERTNLIINADFFYSERLHGFILAYFCKTKCFPLQYSPKFNYFIDDENIEVEYLGLKNIDDINFLYNNSETTIFDRITVSQNRLNINKDLLLKMFK